MKTKNLLSLLLLILAVPANAYRIEIYNREIAGVPVFLAGYYGDRVSVIDSVTADVAGKAVFERRYDLCAGMYTLVAPAKLHYDLLLDVGRQQIRVEWLASGDVRIEGNEQAAAYAAYQTWMDTKPDKEQIAERRIQIAGQYSGTILAAYLTASQPVESPDTDTTGDMNQMMREYRYRRNNFFANMPLSDVRMLHTPLYHETVYYYITKFVTQHADSLIHISYRMLEQASGNYETFYYMSDFLMDFSLRSKIQNINRLYNFVQRNRDMLGTKGVAMLPQRSNNNYFALPDEKSLQNRLQNMSLTDIEGKVFNPLTINSRYCVYYFWKNDCSRCIADASRWQTLLDKYRQRSCTGIAVNIKNDVQQSQNRILAYDPLCVNASTVNMPWCSTVFFVTDYSKIVVTDMDGNIVGLFGSAAAFDNFMRIAR